MRHHWAQLCHNIGMDDVDIDRIWVVIRNRYSESHRYYHTLEHIEDMLKQRLGAPLDDVVTVDLAIIYHDIVYDPTSKTNEEDSAQLFRGCFDWVSLVNVDIEMVCKYIELTKAHDVSAADDNDLKMFIDIDMSILGRDREGYTVYARKIRQEYIHIPDAAYCQGRAAFLRSVISSDKRIFASEMYWGMFEEKARENMNWECSQLESGVLV